MSELTNTENIVYKLLVEGFTVTDIIKLMNVKESTVRSHLKNIFTKKEVSSQQELIVLHYRGKVRNG